MKKLLYISSLKHNFNNNKSNLIIKLKDAGYKKPYIVAAKMLKSKKPMSHYSKINGKLKACFR
jgi:hypothetical protein